MRMFFLFLGNIIFNATGNLLMKMGMKSSDKLEFTFSGILYGLILNPSLIIGAACYFFSLVCYIFVLRRLNLNVAYPLLVSCSIMIVGVMSKLLLKETFSPVHIVGYCLIFAGIFMLARV
jgi:multidrug transporter EmrE-like cation transporter